MNTLKLHTVPCSTFFGRYDPDSGHSNYCGRWTVPRPRAAGNRNSTSGAGTASERRVKRQRARKCHRGETRLSELPCEAQEGGPGRHLPPLRAGPGRAAAPAAASGRARPLGIVRLGRPTLASRAATALSGRNSDASRPLVPSRRDPPASCSGPSSGSHRSRRSPRYLLTTPLVPCLHCARPLPTGNGNQHARPPSGLPLVGAQVSRETGLADPGRRNRAEKRAGKRRLSEPYRLPGCQSRSPDHKAQKPLRPSARPLPSGICSLSHRGPEPLARGRPRDVSAGNYGCAGGGAHRGRQPPPVRSYPVQRETVFDQAFSISASPFRLHNLLCAVGGLAASPGIYPRDVISIHYHQLGQPKMTPAIAKCPWKKNCSPPPTPWRTAACGTMILQSDPQALEGCQDLYKVFSC
ncbi:uncharacterized protein LOC121486964 [Vulpes lagopus]|uniref:uncharacterized protein LOC121486964 n=1 Tax=Vulpes lagopus TaxID=494514 RepID=UPI001BC928E4|nr:uncharacterized protein LOC121486964 [Vulpes lagopus]